MRRLSTVIIPLLAILVFTNGFAQEQKSEWEQLSDGLIWGLNSGNEGLERSAMCFIIKYADSLAVNQVASNIYQIYSSHENPKVRQLALIAIYKMNNVFYLKNLVDDFYGETDPIIRHQIATILKEKPILYAIR
jgi:hypothetical protein